MDILKNKYQPSTVHNLLSRFKASKLRSYLASTTANVITANTFIISVIHVVEQYKIKKNTFILLDFSSGKL